MKELTIISGKGGTGKTSIMGSFASLAKNCVLADADVDAADLHLIIPPTIRQRNDFMGGCKAIINPDQCTQCGECIERCQFNAIDNFIVDTIACEGCGVCVHFCPSDAITFPQRKCGEWFISDTLFGPMIHAKLGIAEENSGLLVTTVRNAARELALAENKDLILADGPPGIGCPVIASITGASAVLIVTEPTLSGIHDLKRVAKLANFLKVPGMLCVNKFDLNPDMCHALLQTSESFHLNHVGNVPYDASMTKAMVAGTSPVLYSDSPASMAIRSVWEKVSAFLL